MHQVAHDAIRALSGRLRREGGLRSGSPAKRHSALTVCEGRAALQPTTAPLLLQHQAGMECGPGRCSATVGCQRAVMDYDTQEAGGRCKHMLTAHTPSVPPRGRTRLYYT